MHGVLGADNPAGRDVDDPQATIEPAVRVRRAVEAEVARPGGERNAYPADDTAVVEICEHDL